MTMYHKIFHDQSGEHVKNTNAAYNDIWLNKDGLREYLTATSVETLFCVLFHNFKEKKEVVEQPVVNEKPLKKKLSKK